MSNTVNINIAASDNGSIDKITAKTKNLNKELTKAQTTAGNIGSKKPATATVAYSKAKKQTDDMFDYRQARSGVGTGAEGRDFAKQAQGLGGLVHVYATFAANIFAVSAAFNALSKAADFTNMVKGLDQLGAASGRNLGTMAKRISDLTDNSVSLKEAMETVAQTSSAGMSDEQINKLALGAKKASQALGRDVGDSLSRLSRGISKVEPELLDELGVFVRVDKAASDYARTLGKTTESLSDFERRQGFTIAVLKQLDEKFGSIDIDANPYSKLLASFTNIMLKGGELINTVLKPLITLLSSSPTALTAALAGIATTLIRQAIPALTQWKTKLAEVAEADAKRAKQLAYSLQEYNINKLLSDSSQAVSKLEASKNAALAALQTTLAKTLPENSKILKKAFSEGFVPKKEDIDQYSAEYGRAMESARRNRSKLDDNSGRTTEEKNRLREMEKADKMRAASMKLAIESANEHIELEKKRTAEVEKRLSKEEKARFASEEHMRTVIAERADVNSRKSGHLTKFQDNIQKIGTFAAFEKLDLDLKADEKLGKLDKAAVKTKATLQGVATMAGTVMGALSGLFMAIGVGVAVIALMDMAFTKNSKQLEEFNKQLDVVESSVLNLSRTMEANFVKGNSMSAKAVEAYGNALYNLAENMNSLIIKSRELDKATIGTWDVFKDNIASLWDGDRISELSKGIATTANSTLSSLTNKDDYSSLLSLIQDITKTGEGLVSTKKLAEAVRDALNSGDKEKAQAIVDKVTEFGEAAKKSGEQIKAYNAAIDASIKEYQTLRNSFLPSDGASKLGLTMLTSAKELSKELKDPKDAVIALGAALKDAEKFSLFDKQDQDNILKYSSEINNATDKLNEYNKKLVETQAELQRLKNMKTVTETYSTNPDGTIPGEGTGATTETRKIPVEQSETYKNLLNTQQTVLQAKTDMINSMSEMVIEFEGAAPRMFSKGAKLISNGIKAQLDIAILGFQKYATSFYKGPGSAKIQADLANKEISIQQKLIEVNTELVLQLERNRLQTEKKLIQDDIKTTEKSTDSGAETKLANLKEREAAITKRESLFYNDDKNTSPKNAKQMASLISDKNVDLGSSANLALTFQGMTQQIDALEQKKKQNSLQGILAEAELDNKHLSDKLDAQNKINSSKLEELDTATSISDIYDKDLENEKLRLKDEIAANEYRKTQLNLLNERNQDNIGGYYALKQYKEGSEEYNKILEALAERQKMREDTLASLKRTNENNHIKQVLDNIDREYAARAKILELEQQVYDLLLADNDRVASQKITTSTIQQKADLEILKQTASIKEEIRKNEDKIAKLPEDSIYIKQHQEQIAYLKQKQELDTVKIQNEAEYQKALIKTEETLRKIESSISLSTDSSHEYIGAVYQDFSNKISELVKTTKSAADAFNSGFINAIDNSIDKFFDMLKEGKLNFSEMAKFLKDSVANAFYDMAKQSIKNAWKDLLVKMGIVKPSDAEQVSEKIASLNTTISARFPELTKAINDLANKGISGTKEDTTKSIDTKTFDSSKTETYGNGTFGTGDAGNNYAISQGYEPLDHKAANDGFYDESTKSMASASKEFDSAAKTMSSNLIDQRSSFEQFGSLFSMAIGAFGGSMGKFGSLIALFGSYILKLAMSSTTSSISGGSSGGGFLSSLFGSNTSSTTSSGGGFLSSLFGGGAVEASAATDVFGMMFAAAKGGVFPGAEGLSKYSNSIVSSPTMFAFAKGGIPPNTGLMGEAGPEAIIPLKRDASGNLGIRSSDNSPKNHITINVSAPGGDPAEVRRSTAAASRTLLNTLNGSRRYG